MARALVHCISGNCSCTKQCKARGCQHPNHRGCTAAAQAEPAQAQLSSSPETGRRQQRFLGSGVAAEPSTGTELRGSSATAPGNDPSYVSAIKKDKLNKTRGSEEWERQGWKSQTPTALSTSTLFSHHKGRQGSRAKSQGGRRLNSQVSQLEKESKKTQGNPGSFLSALALPGNVSLICVLSKNFCSQNPGLSIEPDLILTQSPLPSCLPTWLPIST